MFYALVGYTLPYMANGRYDFARRRKGVRKGRERGCWVYVPKEELEKTGFDPQEDPPAYRLWASDRGRCVIQLYKET